jgi:hypothetical protein
MAIVAITIQTSPVCAGVRCENDLISIGDTSPEVMVKLSRCGTVLDKKMIGKETTVYADNGEKKGGEKVKKETLIEVWFIRVEERGEHYCYPLSFKAGRLQKIGAWSRCE